MFLELARNSKMEREHQLLGWRECLRLVGSLSFAYESMQNAFYFAFQNSSTFWLLGGTNILLDGGGTLDGSGQAWYDAL